MNKNKIIMALLAGVVLSVVFAVPAVFADGSVSWNPSLVEDPVGDEFTVAVEVALEPGDVLNGFVITVDWDPALLECISPAPVSGGLIPSPLALSGPVDNVNGQILDITESTQAAQGATEGGVAFYLDFRVIGVGVSDITLPAVFLDNAGGGVAGASCHVVKNPPPATAPDADFAPAEGTTYIVGDTIDLVDLSLAGYDTLPTPGESTPVTSWTWEYDLDGDGIYEMMYMGETPAPLTADASMVGVDVKIKLTVEAADPTAPTAPDYIPTDSEIHSIVVVPPAGAKNIDVYTERGGMFPDMYSCPYGPQELVRLYALVTFNEAPIVGKEVLFTVRDANNDVIATLQAPTGADGIAMEEFRLPWQDVDPEAYFGEFSVLACVDVAEETICETVRFDYGYILEISDIVVSGSPVARGTGSVDVSVDVESIACDDVSAVLTVTIEDELQVPVANVYSWNTFVNQWSTSTDFIGIGIPNWAYCGTGAAYVSIVSAEPDNFGVPYAPEASEIVVIALV